MLFFVAGILGVIALVLFAGGKKTGNTPLHDGSISVSVTKAPEKEMELVVNTTPIPTSTPKPLPSATPTPIPILTPTPILVVEADLNGAAGDSMDIHDFDQESESTGPFRIFVGDERIQALTSYSDSEKDIWLCQSSADAEWLLNTACPSVTAYAEQNKSIILISLGLNDLVNVEEYTTIINTYAAAWKEKGCKVYFLALGPVESSAYISNQEIMDYNSYIYNNTSCGFIDIYNYLAGGSFVTTDGVNYDSKTSQSIFEYITGNIQ